MQKRHEHSSKQMFVYEHSLVIELKETQSLAITQLLLHFRLQTN